jgi:hypothetical protein
MSVRDKIFIKLSQKHADDADGMDLRSFFICVNLLNLRHLRANIFPKRPY